MHTSGPPARGDCRWIQSASTSLPTPVSPRMSTLIKPLRGAPAGGALRQPIQLSHRLGLEDGPRALALGAAQQRRRPSDQRASVERPSAGYVATAVRTPNPAARTRRAASSAIVRARSGIGVEQQRLVVTRRIEREDITRAQRARNQLGRRAGGLLAVDLDAHDGQVRATARGPRARIVQALLERAVALKAASRRRRTPALDHEVREADRDRLAELDRHALPAVDPLAAHEGAVSALQILDGQRPARIDVEARVQVRSQLVGDADVRIVVAADAYRPTGGSACVSNRFGAITARCSAPLAAVAGSLLVLTRDGWCGHFRQRSARSRSS